MNNITERINYILKHYNLTAGDFADKLGIQKSSVSHLLSERNKPSFQFLTKLLNAFPDINLNWFIAGDGNIFKNSGHIPEYENLTDLEKEDKKESEKEKTAKLPQKKLVNEANPNTNVENIIMVYDDDTFKILNKINP